MRPKLIIVDDSYSNVMLIRQGLAGYTEITVLELPPDKLPTLPNLDAMFLTLPAAERWGARPMLHQAQVLSSRLEDEEDMPPAGIPPYIITGVAMAPDDPRDPIFELRLIITAVLDTVRSFNAENPKPINTIGFWAQNLLIQRMDPKQVGQIIRSSYEEKCSN
jgi:hypothetical protein